MQHVKKAIERAIDIGRYKPNGMSCDGYKSSYRVVVNWYEGAETAIRYFCLDKGFWIALGKAEGWEKSQKICGCGCGGNNCHLRHCDENCFMYNVPIQDWKSNWHSFIDALALGNTPNEFFKEILK